MATLLDIKEPNGHNMFSQAGRVTSAKYAIFRRHDEIFNNQKRVIKVTPLPALAIDISKKENQPKRIKEMKEEVEEKQEACPTMPQKPVIPPFARQLSREEVNKVKEVKTTTPTHGLYTPKYTFIERSSSVMVNYDKARPATSGPVKPTILPEEEISRPIPDKPKKKILGSVFFKHQTARQFFKRTESQIEQRLSEPQPLATPPLNRTRTVASCQTLNRPNRDSSSRRSGASFSISRTLTYGSPKASLNQTFGRRLVRNTSEIPLNLDNCSPKNDDK